MLNLSKRRLSIGLKRHLLDTHKKNISTFHEVSILLFLKKLLFIFKALKKSSRVVPLYFKTFKYIWYFMSWHAYTLMGHS